MFRNRTNSQKPTDELYASFKQHFPEVGPGTASSSAAPSESRTSLSDALTDAAMNQRQFDETDDLKDMDPTPRGSNEPWRFTPSLLDPSSFAFAAFANQPSGYYTPTPGGTNTLYHSQAGDLHTPGMGIHLGTPLSLPAADGSIHSMSSMDMQGFNPHLLQTHSFHNANPFAPQQTFAPASFVHQDSGYEAMDPSADGSPENEVIMETDLQKESRAMDFSSRQFVGTMPAPPIPSTEKFRYHVTLNAATAMIRHADEIPVTYLNKGQAYSISIIDTVPLVPSPVPIKYRTFIRISFEDEQQRLRPSTCWQLWKEGRGLAEAHQRGGKLQAVEYVDPNQGGDEETRRAGVELESASFDGFSVTWTPNTATSTADCSVAVRFNFLSTDFSHSKGVKGIPVRLCAKTEIISSGTPDTPPLAGPEVCYCKVKLFRDHGAERKLSNDVAHVKKTIEKLKQQITQAESGMNDFGKRKRSGSTTTKGRSSRPSKIQKHKRTWSMSSQSSAGGRPMAEEDLHLKLATMSDMFSSTRPFSVFYLRGYEQDDPDLFPVSLPGEPQDLTKVQAISRQASWDRRPSGETTPTNSCLVSPSPSSRSLPAQPPSHERESFKKPKPKPVDPAQIVPSDWINFSHVSDLDYASANPQGFPGAPASQPVKVQRGQTDSSLPEWIETLGVDTTYRPPPERPVKPVACFYVLIKVAGQTPEDDYYRAVYLMQRTVKDLISSIASKCQVHPDRVVRTFRVNSKGLKILVDDEVVRELPEAQDMTVEFSEINSDKPVKLERSTPTLGNAAEHDATIGDATATTALEMKLLF